MPKSDVAISINGLSKAYTISHNDVKRATFREAVMHRLRNPMRRVSEETFWALRDVSFDVKKGEVVGIIGRNGAGKSTLLKILSRIAEPTAGRIELYGRVGSLLEVGTGFHPELTGRENIFLNGTILGMSRGEVRRQFDAIVSFAEIEKFLDTPVKHYSSGMYVRLAFAVAAHLNPEILLVDEVLAVGDASFQSKCMGKMGEVAKAGRTVLFVSHNMASIQSLCSTGVMLEGGAVTSAGNVDRVIADYLSKCNDVASGEVSLTAHPGRRRGMKPMMTDVQVLDLQGRIISVLPMGGSIDVRVGFKSSQRRIEPVLGIVVKNSMSAPIFGVNNRFIGANRAALSDHGAVTCRLENLPLMPGRHYLDLYFGDMHQNYDVIENAVAIDVNHADVFGTGKLPPASAGPIYWPATWSIQPAASALSSSN